MNRLLAVDKPPTSAGESTMLPGPETETTVERLNAAAELVRRDPAPDPLMRAIGEWLRAEALTQGAMEPMVELFGIAYKTTSGREAGLSIGRREDGEIAMYSSTNEHALAVADLVTKAYRP